MQRQIWSSAPRTRLCSDRDGHLVEGGFVVPGQGTKDKGGWWLLSIGKIAPIEVGLNSAIYVIGTEVQFKQVRVHEEMMQGKLGCLQGGLGAGVGQLLVGEIQMGAGACVPWMHSCMGPCLLQMK